MHRINRFIAPLAVALSALVVAAVPAHADDRSFLQYLNGHGYTGSYAGGEPIPPVSAVALGHMICENLHVGRSVEQQQPNYPAWPQFPLIAEAAQLELCPSSPR